MSDIVYNLGDSAVFCAFHDLHVPIPIQLPQRNSASAAHVCTHAQLTRCFSAVAELLVTACFTRALHRCQDIIYCTGLCYYCVDMSALTLEILITLFVIVTLSQSLAC